MLYACRTNAASITSVRPSVRRPSVVLVDCDRAVQRKVEIGSRHNYDRIGRCLGYLYAKADLTQILISCMWIPYSTEEDQ